MQRYVALQSWLTNLVDRTLIMGAAIGYSEQQISPFLTSLRKSGYTGDVVLVVGTSLARRARSQPLFHGVTLLSSPHWFPFKYGLFQRRRTFKWFVRPILFPLWGLVRILGKFPLNEDWRLRLQGMITQYSMSPTETRFLRYLRFLQRHNYYSRILISDVKDVLFQQDPFLGLPLSGLAVGMELRRKTIGSEPWNAWTVRLVYGPHVLEQIGTKPVSCSGVTYGDRASMLRYLKLMTSEILSLNFRATWQPLDQALHNYILWTGKFGEFQPLDLFQSPLATLSDVDEQLIQLNAQGKLLNQDGSVVSIVHQYDRLPRLKAILLDSLAR